MLNISDLAKYPFIPEAVKYVKNLNIDIETLVKNDTQLFNMLNQYTMQRINNTIEGKEKREIKDANIDIISYPRAIMLLDYLADEITNRRFALFESKQAYNFLKLDTNENIAYLANTAFQWKIQLVRARYKSLFKIHCSVHSRCRGPIYYFHTIGPLGRHTNKASQYISQ